MLVENGVLGARPGCEGSMRAVAQNWGCQLSCDKKLGGGEENVPESNQSPGQFISLLLNCVICREASSDTQK